MISLRVSKTNLANKNVPDKIPSKFSEYTQNKQFLTHVIVCSFFLLNNYFNSVSKTGELSPLKINQSGRNS